MRAGWLKVRCGFKVWDGVRNRGGGPGGRAEVGLRVRFVWVRCEASKRL